MGRRFIALAVGIAGSLVACTNPDAREDRPRPATDRSPVARPSPELVGTRIPVPGQPAALLLDRGSLWVGGSLLVRVEDDRVIDRLWTGVSRMGIVRAGGRLWATGGGDGGAPNGSLVGFDIDGGKREERVVFPGRSPYGIDAGNRGIFVALFQGDLLWMNREGEVTSSVRLSDGLTQVLVAHRKVWVSSPQAGKVWRVTLNRNGEMSAAATSFTRRAKKACPQGLETSKTKIWVADPCAHKVWVLDARGEVTGVIEGLGRPLDLDVTGRIAWIVSFGSSVVRVVDVDSLDVLAQTRAGRRAVAVAAHGREAWVANHEGYSLTHLELR